MALWAFCRAKVGLSTEEFWQSTPREIQALVDAFTDQQITENVRAGTIAAMTMNAARTDRKQKVFTWRDFFDDPRPRPMQTPEQIAAAFENLHAIVVAQREAKGE